MSVKLGLTLKEEHILMVSENRDLREKMTEGWRFAKYYQGYQVKEDEMGCACSMHKSDEKIL
jgi:hypothetical protein